MHYCWLKTLTDLITHGRPVFRADKFNLLPFSPYSSLNPASSINFISELTWTYRVAPHGSSHCPRCSAVPCQVCQALVGNGLSKLHVSQQGPQHFAGEGICREDEASAVCMHGWGNPRWKTPRPQRSVSIAAFSFKWKQPRHTVLWLCPIAVHLKTWLLARALQVTDHYKKRI